MYTIQIKEVRTGERSHSKLLKKLNNGTKIEKEMFTGIRMKDVKKS